MEDRSSLVLADCCGDSRTGARAIWELATSLPEARFDSEVWLPAIGAGTELADPLAAAGVSCESLPDVEGGWARRLRLWRRVRRSRPTLLHLHVDEDEGDRLTGALAAATPAEHLVVSVHGPRVAGSFANRPRLHQALRRADAVTACCSAVAETLIQTARLERALVHVVPPGIDPPDDDAECEEAQHLRERFGAGPVRKLWVCIGRLEPSKGHAVFLEALARLAESGVPFAAVIAGEGPLRAALARRAGALELADRVTLVGNEVDPLALVEAADAVVIPSHWDALPSVLLEALVRGRPVIAAATGGIPEALEEGVTGRLVPPGDGAALAEALEAAYRGPEAMRRMGAAGARWGLERFLWPNVVEAFESLYDDVLGLTTFRPAALATDEHAGARA